MTLTFNGSIVLENWLCHDPICVKNLELDQYGECGIQIWIPNIIFLAHIDLDIAPKLYEIQKTVVNYSKDKL